MPHKHLVIEIPDAQKPQRYSPSLTGTEDFPSHGDWLIPLLESILVDPGGNLIKLDDWQKWLLKHILEIYPPGHKNAGQLRYRQVLNSMGRQNGKSLLGSSMGFYGLLVAPGTPVLGLATSVDQAGVIYNTMKSAIDAPGSKVKQFFRRSTATRGLETKQGSTYVVKAPTTKALQGKTARFTNIDELHILLRSTWDDAVNGLRSIKSGMVCGFTTAGDDESELLLWLYERTTKEASERFGWFIWEAPEAEIPEDPATFREWLAMANPAIACGRIDVETTISDLEGKPREDIIRYALNRFVGSVNDFIPVSEWLKCGGTVSEPVKPIISIDRTPDWEHASIVAAWEKDGKTHTEVVASVAQPTMEKLTDLCVSIASKMEVSSFVADGYSLKPLMEELRRRGLPARWSTLGDMVGASSFFFAQIKRNKLVHANDPLLSVQLPRTQRKNVGDSFKISKKDSDAHIDTVIATALAVYSVETVNEMPLQIFF